MKKQNKSPGKHSVSHTPYPTSELQAKLTELTEALQRERADAINLRRRYDEHINGLRTTITTNVVRDFLPVIDNFERLLQHIPPNSKGNPWTEGVAAVAKQFQKILSDLGVERIKTVGEPFDPRWHEAVGSEGEGSHETVSQELQAGYRISENVLRPAMVKVKIVH